MITTDELAILRKPEVQAYIREKMGKWEIGNLYLFAERFYVVDREKQSVLNYYYQNDEKYIRIPDCISRDSARPERGLWGMLDDSWEIIKPCLSDRWMVRCLAEQMDQGPDALCYTQNISFSGTPRLALLKALLWQIERGKT